MNSNRNTTRVKLPIYDVTKGAFIKCNNNELTTANIVIESIALRFTNQIGTMEPLIRSKSLHYFCIDCQTRARITLRTSGKY